VRSKLKKGVQRGSSGKNLTSLFLTIYADHELEIILRPFLKLRPPTTSDPYDHPTLRLGEEGGIIWNTQQIVLTLKSPPHLLSPCLSRVVRGSEGVGGQNFKNGLKVISSSWSAYIRWEMSRSNFFRSGLNFFQLWPHLMTAFDLVRKNDYGKICSSSTGLQHASVVLGSRGDPSFGLWPWPWMPLQVKVGDKNSYLDVFYKERPPIRGLVILTHSFKIRLFWVVEARKLTRVSWPLTVPSSFIITYSKLY